MNKQHIELAQIINKWGYPLTEWDDIEFVKKWKKNFDLAMRVGDNREYEILSTSDKFIESEYGHHV